MHAAQDLSHHGMLVRCIASLAVMIPWPLFGLLVMQRSFEHWNEALLLIGGVTGLPLMVLALLGVPEPAWLTMLVLVWLLAAIAPAVWLARRSRSRDVVITVLGLQSTFSLAQAAVGAMMILGKNI